MVCPEKNRRRSGATSIAAACRPDPQAGGRASGQLDGAGLAARSEPAGPGGRRGRVPGREGRSAAVGRLTRQCEVH